MHKSITNGIPLCSSDSKARFLLFKKGAGLETIEEEIATCEEYAKTIEAHLERRKEVGD